MLSVTPSSSDSAGRVRRILALVGRRWAPHLGAAAAIFVASAFVGGAVGSERASPLLPVASGRNPYAGVDATALFLHNGRVAAFLVLGVLAFGLPTLYLLLLNGFLFGAGLTDFAAAFGVGPTLAMVLPHGVFELPAIVLAGAIAVRWCHLGWQVTRGDVEHGTVPRTLVETAVALVLVVALLGVAAVIEATVSGAIGAALT